MPKPSKQKTKFFVFIIESPSDDDLHENRSEGSMIKHAIELNKVKCILEKVNSLAEFKDCMYKFNDAMIDQPDCIPILHISAHGNNEEIGLLNGDRINWNELREILRPVNEVSNNESLVLCMSSCNGFKAIDMAKHPDKNQNLPYFALIGTNNEPNWAETAVAYTTLYHQLYRGEHIDYAVNAMSYASGHEFLVKNSENTRQEYIKNLNSPYLNDDIMHRIDRPRFKQIKALQRFPPKPGRTDNLLLPNMMI